MLGTPVVTKEACALLGYRYLSALNVAINGICMCIGAVAPVVMCHSAVVEENGGGLSLSKSQILLTNSSGDQGFCKYSI